MTLRIFINERAVSVPEGSDVVSVVDMFDATLAASVRAGRAYVTDGVGREIDSDSTVKTGDILRVVVSARRGATDGTTA